MNPPLDRRHFLAVTGTSTAAMTLAAADGGTAHASPGTNTSGAPVAHDANTPVQPFPLGSVTLLDSAFRANQQRNSAYLRFVDIDRLLHTFRTNVGLPSSVRPCGGWEGPSVELRGHSTGHLLSGLALAHANTGERALRDKGHRLVAALAECQAASPAAGFGAGYLSAFPESFFDRLDAGTGVWAPYYTMHKIMAGLVEQHRLTGSGQALDVVLRQAEWVDRRTEPLSHEQMQRVLETEFGGMNDVLADLHALTGDAKWLDVAERFTHARVFDPLARNEDRLAGLHANTQIPKMVGALRLWEEGLPDRYRTIAENFWQIVTDHHTYVIGGNSNGEGFHEPDVIAAQLSNNTCENCNSYNMLKLTRLLHFHAPRRTDLLDYYERTLFNQMLGEQDPDAAHGFNIYYTGLGPGAFKQQPSFMGTDPAAYSTDYDNFSCDHGTGMETQAKFADTVYSHDRHRLLVNLFIPSQVNWRERNITWRQTTSFPDRSSTVLTVTAGRAAHQLLVRIPSWAADARATLNGRALPDRPEPGSWLTLDREWRAGDRVEVSLPMRTVIEPTPDDPDVQAVLHGPVVLAGAYGDRAMPRLPRLDTGSLRQESQEPLRFTARADGEDISLLPISRVHHQHYSVYWLTGEPPPPRDLRDHGRRRHREREGGPARRRCRLDGGRRRRWCGGARWHGRVRTPGRRPPRGRRRLHTGHLGAAGRPTRCLEQGVRPRHRRHGQHVPHPAQRRRHPSLRHHRRRRGRRATHRRRAAAHRPLGACGGDVRRRDRRPVCGRAGGRAQRPGHGGSTLLRQPHPCRVPRQVAVRRPLSEGCGRRLPCVRQDPHGRGGRRPGPGLGDATSTCAQDGWGRGAAGPSPGSTETRRAAKMITPDRNASSTPLDPSRRSLLRAMVAIPATALVLGELPGLLGSAAAAAPAHGSATRYTIVPFLNSDDGTVNVYQSDDATDFRLVKSSAYTPPSNRIRDASVFKHTDGYYYITYTTHTWQDVSTTIGFARSSDRANWTFLYDYTVPITGLSRAWAPEWFVDSDGSVNVIVSCSTTDDEWIFTPYVMKAANSALTAWSSPVALSGIGANHIDTFIVKIGSTYHAFPKNETTKYIEYATASSLTGPYTITRTGDWAGLGWHP